MNKETRGYIEEALDKVLEQDVLNRMQWVLDEYQIESVQEFALGYMLGSLMSTAYEIVRRNKLFEMTDKRLDKEIGRKRRKEIRKQFEEKEEKVKPIRVSLSEKEENQIRDMLRRRISDYRQKIYRELNR